MTNTTLALSLVLLSVVGCGSESARFVASDSRPAPQFLTEEASAAAADGQTLVVLVEIPEWQAVYENRESSENVNLIAVDGHHGLGMGITFIHRVSVFPSALAFDGHGNLVGSFAGLGNDEERMRWMKNPTANSGNIHQIGCPACSGAL